MILTEYLLSQKSIQWQFAKQLGINHAVIRLPEDEAFNINDTSHWEAVYKRFADEGLKPVVIEPMPNALHDHIKIGDEKRDECIEKVIKMLPIMDRLDTRTICFNFMAYIGWYRTARDIKERGGALVTGFDINDVKVKDHFHITEEQLWDNLIYFLKAVVPYVEKYDIKLALHPDDPPVSYLGGVSRILTSMRAVDRAIHLVESSHVGVTLCQGTYAAMGEDVEAVIRHFGALRKIFFVHFRDIKGDRFHFHETFHDNGQTDMAKAVQTYKECNYQGPIRVDHVPSMAGEGNEIPGYDTVGRLFAVGYLKGILDASHYAYK